MSMKICWFAVTAWFWSLAVDVVLPMVEPWWRLTSVVAIDSYVYLRVHTYVLYIYILNIQENKQSHSNGGLK